MAECQRHLSAQSRLLLLHLPRPSKLPSSKRLDRRWPTRSRSIGRGGSISPQPMHKLRGEVERRLRACCGTDYGKFWLSGARERGGVIRINAGDAIRNAGAKLTPGSPSGTSAIPTALLKGAVPECPAFRPNDCCGLRPVSECSLTSLLTYAALSHPQSSLRICFILTRRSPLGAAHKVL